MSKSVVVRRILVALDASPESLAAAEAAARLASLLEAEILGLFVEDARLLRLSTSPLAREMGLLTASPRALEGHVVERQLQAQAMRAHRALREIAERRGIRWSFRTARGAVSAEIVAAAAEADLVSLGRLGWSARPRPRLGGIARALIARERGRTLLLRRARRIEDPVTAIYDGSEAAREGLALAESVARAGDQKLRVLLVGEEELPLRKDLHELVSAEPGRLEARWLGAAEGPQIAHAAAIGPTGLLVLPLGSPPLDENLLTRLLDRLDCPLLVVH